MGNLSPTYSAMSLYNSKCQLLLVWLFFFLKPKVVQFVVKFSRRLCLFQCSSPQLLLLESGLLALVPTLGGWRGEAHLCNTPAPPATLCIGAHQ